MTDTKNCACGHAQEFHDGDYCAASGTDGFCGCDRFIEAKPAEKPAPTTKKTDK